jgi:glycosyltransferase involved in cell wall biosynthesis
MKFSIITPTYRRADRLAYAVASVKSQRHTDWEMIIVNDSPLDTTYSSFEHTTHDPRIRYFKNAVNKGVNASRNRALDEVSPDSTWIIFLDDDDYLAPDALQTCAKLINTYPHTMWFVTNRTYKDGTSITSFPYDDAHYSYAWDYLILKRGRGDATHCIQKKTMNNIRFATQIRQAEEWLFFYELGLRTTLFYHNYTSTLTEGYGPDGLNFRKRTRREQLHTLSALVEEGAWRGLLYRPTFIIYLCMRFVRILVR